MDDLAYSYTDVVRPMFGRCLLARSSSRVPVDIPLGYPSSLICLDESGARASGGDTFVIGGVKLRKPGLFAREMRALRDTWDFGREFRFSAITRGSFSMYCDLLDRLEASDAHIIGCVVRTADFNPFGRGKPTWLAHAEIATQLVVGATNRCEVVSLYMDGISTPPGKSLEDTVKSQANRRLGGLSVVTAVCADSRTSDLLQVADIVAGCIMFERRRSLDGTGNANGHKGKIAARLGVAFNNPGLDDGRSQRVNIATFLGRPPRERSILSVVARPAS